MTIDQIIQLMRTCSLAKVRKQLEKMEKKNPEAYKAIANFYKEAVK